MADFSNSLKFWMRKLNESVPLEDRQRGRSRIRWMDQGIELGEWTGIEAD